MHPIGVAHPEVFCDRVARDRAARSCPRDVAREKINHMTSQIVLMNGFGLALASDSAMTVGSRTRTYETAEKIIPLPEPHRLAVMIAGNSRIGNLPYSLLLGEWTRQLGTKALRSPKSYYEHFIDWLESNSNLLAVDTEEAQVMRFVEERLAKIAEVYESVKSEDSDFELSELLEEWTAEVREGNRLEGLDEPDALNLFTKHSIEIDKRFEYFLKEIKNYEDERARVSSYLAAFYSSEFMARRVTSSTLVFAGFGEREILPSFIQVGITGFAQGRITHRVNESWSLTADKNPLWGICLPAQRDAIDQYLSGYEKALLDELINLALEGLSELGERMLETVSMEDSEANAFRQLVSEHHTELDNSLNETIRKYSEDNYLGSLRQTIASLSPADLVDVARSLIELQALRQTTTGQLNTVGGPIDVALISPLTGFEWVHHKTISKG